MTLSKRFKCQLAIGAAVLCAAAAQSAMAANVSISVVQPGVYGRINIGEPIEQGSWINQQPIVYRQSAYTAARQPIYLYVPAAHSNNWGRYCGRYNACAQPVVFVQDGWVRGRYERDHGYGYGRGGKKGKHGDRDHDGVQNNRDRDRDGDGVRNPYDRHPNNPNRR